ncbi:MAG TPA: MFS transporter, partial [Oligoflexia bacterium]|nr:MFS transporter [Oligoflexia bacterium]
FLFGFFVLPESLAVKHRRKMTARALNPFRSLKHVLSLPAIQVLLAVHVLTQLAGQTHPSIWTLYTQHRYGWNAASVGLSLAVVGILSAFSQGVLTGVFVKRFGERKTVLLGCLGEGLCFALFGLAFNGPMLYAVLLIASIFWSMHPALQALISRDVPDNQQGELQGSLMSLTSLTSIVNPLIMTSLFAAFSNRTSGLYLPGAPYFLGCALLLAAWLLLATSGRAPMMPKKALEG